MGRQWDGSGGMGLLARPSPFSTPPSVNAAATNPAARLGKINWFSGRGRAWRPAPRLGPACGTGVVHERLARYARQRVRSAARSWWERSRCRRTDPNTHQARLRNPCQYPRPLRTQSVFYPMPYLVFLAVCLAWSISFLLMKKAAVVMSPASIGLWRVVAGSAVLGLIWVCRDRQWNFRSRDVWPMLVVVLAGCAWPYSIQPWVISREGSAFMALMVSFVPLLTILMTVALTRTWPARRQLLGVIGALGCLAVLLGDGWQRNVPPQHLLAALSVPTCYAIANVTIRHRLPHASAILVTFVSMFATIWLLLPVVNAVGPPPAPPDSAWFPALISLTFLGIVGTGLATFGFNWLIRQHGPLFAGMTTNVVPLGAILFGWLDGERITGMQLGAILGIVSMVTLVQYRAAARTVLPEPTAQDPADQAVAPSQTAADLSNTSEQA